ncbi:Hypothetical predicted protein, partial [Pelobates cultripes]
MYREWRPRANKAGSPRAYRETQGMAAATGEAEGRAKRNAQSGRRQLPKLPIRNRPIDNSSGEWKSELGAPSDNPWRQTDAESSADRKAAGEGISRLARTTA